MGGRGVVLGVNRKKTFKCIMINEKISKKRSKLGMLEDVAFSILKRWLICFLCCAKIPDTWIPWDFIILVGLDNHGWTTQQIPLFFCSGLKR